MDFQVHLGGTDARALNLSNPFFIEDDIISISFTTLVICVPPSRAISEFAGFFFNAISFVIIWLLIWFDWFILHFRRVRSPHPVCHYPAPPPNSCSPSRCWQHTSAVVAADCRWSLMALLGEGLACRCAGCVCIEASSSTCALCCWEDMCPVDLRLAAVHCPVLPAGSTPRATRSPALHLLITVYASISAIELLLQLLHSCCRWPCCQVDWRCITGLKIKMNIL